VLVERESLDRLRQEAQPAPLAPVDETAAADAATALDLTGEPAQLDPMQVERRTERTGTLLGNLGGGPD